MAQAQKMTKSALFAFFADKFEVKRTEVRDWFDELAARRQRSPIERSAAVSSGGSSTSSSRSIPTRRNAAEAAVSLASCTRVVPSPRSV